MAQPPSFYGRAPQVGRMPVPIDTAQPLVQGVDAVARAAAGAAQSAEATDERVRESDLQVARVARERDLQLKSGTIAAKIAEGAGQLDVDLAQLRAASQPGAAGHEEAVQERIDKFRDSVTEQIGTDPDLQARFGDNIVTIAATARSNEVKWALGQRAEKSVTDSDTLQNNLQGNIRTAIAGGTFTGKMMADADALDARAVEALPIGGNAKAQLTRARHLERVVTQISASTDVDPHGVIDAIDKGQFSELDDKVLAPLRSHALERANQIDNKIEQQANEAAAVARAEAGNVIEDVNKGTHVNPATLQSYYDQVKGSQKPEDIRLTHDLEGAIVKNGVTAKYDNSTNPQRTDVLHEIEGTKGWQEKPELVAAHAQLQTLINRDAHAADADPVSLYARQTGQALPPLKLDDPAAMRARFTAGDRAAERFNKPLPMHFTEAEAKELRDQYNQASVDGKASFIQTLGTFGSKRARQMMAQIAPTKPELVRLAELGAAKDPAVRLLVREASDGSQVPVKDGVAGVVRSQAQRELGSAFAKMPGDRQQAMIQVATWIYAHRASAAAKAGQVDPQIVRDSIGAALGGVGGKGGVGKRNGETVVLPMGSTQDDFDRLLAIASPEDYRAASNGVPKWSNGHDLTLGEFRNLVPVLINDTGTQTIYAFRSRGGSGYVKTERNGDYVVDTRRLAASLLARPR